MLEHMIYVNTWFPKYEVDLAEQTHYAVFVSDRRHSPQPLTTPFLSQSQKANIQTSECVREVKHDKAEAPKQQTEQVRPYDSIARAFAPDPFLAE